MTFTYVPNLLGEVDPEGLPTLAGLRNEVRFLVGDNTSDPETQYVQDEEINFLVIRWYPVEGSAEYVASVLADSIAAKFAGETNFSADGVSIGLGAIAQQFRELAIQLRAQHKNRMKNGAPDAGGMNENERLAPGVRPFSFGTQMHDNWEAGQEDWSGTEQFNWPEEYNR